MHATVWDWKKVNTAMDKNSDCTLTAPLVKSFWDALIFDALFPKTQNK